MISYECKYCHKQKKIYFQDKNDLFCDDFCKYNYLKKNKKNTICKICKKEFLHNGEKIVCSDGCCEKYLENLNIKKNKEDFFFYNFLKNSINSKSKIIIKKWGLEVIIANNQNYCLKYLFFNKNKSMSFHYHEMKTELWHCIYGKLECIIENVNLNEKFDFIPGDKIEIEPLTKHQLISKENSIIIEVSTRDFPEDSYRITLST